MGGHSATFATFTRKPWRRPGAPAPSGFEGLPFDGLRAGFNRHDRELGALAVGADVAAGGEGGGGGGQTGSARSPRRYSRPAARAFGRLSSKWGTATPRRWSVV